MLVNEDSIPITESWLASVGFVIDEDNRHIYETRAVGDIFNVLKDKEGANDSFYVKFHSYYEDECLFYGFKYQHQILNLYYCLTGKELRTN